MKRKSTVAVILIVVVSMMCSVGFGGDKRGHKKGLSAKLGDVVKKLFPTGKITKTEWEEESIKSLEVNLVQDGKECSVNLTADGTVLSKEVEVSRKDLPKAVARALRKEAGKAKIIKIEKEEISAVVQVVKLKKPVNIYEAKFVKDGKTYEIEISQSGKVLKVEADDDEEDGDHDDDDDDDEVSLKDVPDAVRATIKKISKGGEVEEIEREKEDGKVVYEVEIEYGEKEVEFKIAPNGKVLSKKVEDDDDDDDHDN